MVQPIENDRKRDEMELSGDNCGLLNESVSREYANFGLCHTPGHTEIAAPVASQEVVF